MKRWHGMIAAALAVTGLVTAVAAQARDRAEAWRIWSDRAQAIHDALTADSDIGLKPACNGVTGMLIGQGFQFPHWAQGLMKLCQVSKENWLYQGSRRGQKRWCGDLKDVASQLGKAEPVAEAPRASVIALELSGGARAVYDRVCR